MTELAVVVPTVDRASVLEALVENIHDTTATSHRVYLVMEDDDLDSLRVAKRTRAVSISGQFGSNAAAVNAGYWNTGEPFLAIVNDDCRFIAGWDTAALKYFSDTVHVVGINQGDGNCTCFSMVRRAFIKQHSGVFDRPDALYHEYVSQFPDTEFAEYARHRGVWADAPDSVIEHLHWVFGKGDANHPNYQKARDTFPIDQPVFLERQRQYLAR